MSYRSLLVIYHKYPNLVFTKKKLFSRVRTIIRTKKIIPKKKVRTKLESTNFFFFFDRYALIFRDVMKEKRQMTWKKNWTSSLKSTEQAIVNQNSFRVLSILCIKNFCETGKINSNAIQVLLLLLSFGKSRKYSLN